MKNILLLFSLVLFSLSLCAQSIDLNSDGSLEVTGEFIRKVTYATGNGPDVGTDVGQITSRVLSFDKKYTDTKLRISYTDNFRVIGSCACRWQIFIDGLECSGTNLDYNLFVNDGNTHQFSTVVGYCEPISAGTIEIQIWVGSSPGYAGCDCQTGWNNSAWVLEVEEVY